MKKIFLILVAVLFFCNNLYALDLFQVKPNNTVVSDFTLWDLSGNSISLNDYKDKAIILFFWTTWCPHCRTQLSNFISEYDNLKSANIELLAIDIGESKARIQSFLSKYSVKFPILLDLDSEVASKYGVVGVPTIVLISNKGNIVSTSYALPDNYQNLLKEQ